MNKYIKINLLVAMLGFAAISPPSVAAAPKGGSPLHFVLTAGLTAGGDTIDELNYTNGGTAKIKGGSHIGLMGYFAF